LVWSINISSSAGLLADTTPSGADATDFITETVAPSMTQRTLTVTGMSCGGCEENVETGLSELDGVSGVDADHESDTVEVTTDETVSDDDLAEAVQAAGYELGA
jgi:copper chaperone